MVGRGFREDARVLPRLLALTVAAGVLAPAAATAQTAPAPPGADPCADAALRCPDLVMRTPSHLTPRRGPTGKLLLASTNAIVNIGDGPAELRATRVGSTRTMRARQVIRGRTAAATQVLAPSARIDFFDTGTRGTLWKWRHALRFQLRAVGADGTLGRVVSRSPKIYSCLRDLRRLQRLNGGGSYPGSPRAAHFGACSTDPGQRQVTLGTSVGWGDIYPFGYPQNSVPIGGLSGCFRYEHVVDPLDQVQEADETNNTAGVTVRLPWRGAGRRGCPVVRG